MWQRSRHDARGLLHGVHAAMLNLPMVCRWYAVARAESAVATPSSDRRANLVRAFNVVTGWTPTGQESLEIDHRDLVRVRNPPLFTHAKCPGPHEQPANDYDNYPQSTRRRRDLDQRMPYPEMSDLPVNIRCGNSHA